jgi:predicted PurR-regulated permease PerM
MLIIAGEVTMNLDTALSLKDFFFILLGIGLLILVVYLILFFRNLIITLKSTNKVLEDTQKITAIASERAQDVDKIVTNVSESVEKLTKNIKGNSGAVGFIGSLINFLTSLKGIMSNRKSKKDKE